ncbi:MAG: hypothetical protein UV61_C0005G0014 [Candidatus Gottesmanbacteria bacterium GW2011_GWB1_43_11]|uniref:Uncharacterized protein n=1 Tax=Candidatus Gottesmanbacteria bacterium GW2011_GWB1_43_11 TaxID=1618446 RepID=A0A0G1FJF5_9BACT|nr:MAG: hypothetical protein UV04_C0010G0014 [Candidatus Gottesmanbacteria bacterium GW2011_GWA2_42_16]KKS55905.1 MAG: hypothetical protein UV17_C0005G0014 [Candidatus Gottesmanbacteria bacterium GW2011_GWA1_42_26]KKS86993.1 MAG: hypothetical protein UV61_C0005G0014 [Candidatus Gottesmanbacteria bacterium GW2011_GWB1_43_11]
MKLLVSRGMKIVKGVLLVANQDQNTSIPKEFDDKMRAFANLLIDRILEDQRNNQLNFVVKEATIIKGKPKLKVIIPMSLTYTVKRKLQFSRIQWKQI